MKKVLITGGAGFIGSHLSQLLIEREYKVLCLDNCLTGRKDNIKDLLDNDNFKFIEHDISEPIEFDEDIDYILHFASPASPRDYLDYPIKTLKVNSLGTHNALGIAKKKNAVFMLASTSEVYGDPQEHPQKESYWGNVNCLGPRGVYDESKRFAEAISTAYKNKHGLDVKIARIFNTYGPRMRKDDGRAIPNFICQALNNKPLTVYGDGSQTRSFCYIDDLIEGLFKLMQSDKQEPFNLGSPYEMSILDLAKKIIKLSGSDSNITYKPLPKDDPKVRRPDITKAKEHLNWQPTVKVDEGLKKTIQWFKDNS
jgi:dTDP-glucose 4,6-dehydratase